MSRVLSKLPLLGPGEKSWRWPSSLLLGHGMRPWYPRTSARRGSGGIPNTACVQSGDGFIQTEGKKKPCCNGWANGNKQRSPSTGFWDYRSCYAPFVVATKPATGYSWSSLNSPLGLLDSIGRLDLSLNMEVEPQMLSTLLAIHILIDTHG